MVGLALTAVITVAAQRANDNNNRALLRLDVRQVGATLSASVSSIQNELTDAVSEAGATNSPAAFEAFATKTVIGHNFSSVSLWTRTPQGLVRLATVGRVPQIVSDGRASSFFAHLHPKSSVQLTGFLPGATPVLGYAESPPGDTRYVVYAESPLPKNRRFTFPSSSPFGQLNYAFYLGPKVESSQLIAASATLPFAGPTANTSLPFGDSTITVVAAPRARLSSVLSAALPWIVLAVGVTLSVVAAAMVEFVGRRRRHAEDLALELQRLHAEQRSIAETLQHALLPETLPDVPGFELAARYLPGVEGVDVGGDWYDFVTPEDGRLVFLIGDVSGRGVRAAAVMACLRFAAHAYALEGHEPDAILTRLRKMLDFDRDGYFATVLCGSVDLGQHRLVLAAAGHPPAILRTSDNTAAISSAISPPIGVMLNGVTPRSTAVALPPASTLIAYTDGLIERRGQRLRDEVHKLERSVAQENGSLDGLLDSIVADFTAKTPDDDIALIGIKWLT